MDTRITISVSKITVEEEEDEEEEREEEEAEKEEKRRRSDPRLPGPPSVQGISGGTRTRNRRIPTDFRAGSLSATCLRASWKFGNALVSIVANDLKINRAPTPETNQTPKGSII
ncbi:hypothetical protein PoB_003927700 [Plakobranchus ocellatus]|uniref:Uncharacterized protein n=1 Tax=Plakobranchus ocellatus TaxID=259542 RepID=A0AAV4AZQ8_9GAST|nr:hypothetical protein PoB_003927700 [Plakobranchus ocellatus]